MKTVRLQRREMLTGGTLALLGAGFLSRVDRVAAMQKAPSQRGPSLTEQVRKQAGGASQKLLLGPKPGEEGPPQPDSYDRLPLEWNKQTVRRFKEKLAGLGVEAFLVRDELNIIYLTGYWHKKTERPQAAFLNKDQVFVSPKLK